MKTLSVYINESISPDIMEPILVVLSQLLIASGAATYSIVNQCRDKAEDSRLYSEERKQWQMLHADIRNKYGFRKVEDITAQWQNAYRELSSSSQTSHWGRNDVHNFIESKVKKIYPPEFQEPVIQLTSELQEKMYKFIK